MLRLLPFILIPVLVIAGLGYWRYLASKPNPSGGQSTQAFQPIEVPKTAPDASLEDRVKALEDLAAKMVVQINNLKSLASSNQTTSNSSNQSTLETSVADLQSRVANLEKASPTAVVSAAKPVIYIPLGSGGGPWGDQTWNTLNEYQVQIDPANYPGYSGMQLEANFRLGEAAGTGSVRLYNVTDASVTSGQLDNTSTNFMVQSTASFKLAAGQKTYTIQVQSSAGKSLFVQNARLKVSF